MGKATLGTPRSVDELVKPFTQELMELGINYVGHTVVSFLGDQSGYMSHDTWKREYADKKLFHRDMIIKTFLRDPSSPVHWGPMRSSSVALTRSHIVKTISGVTICNWKESFLTFLNIGFPNEVETEKFLKEYQPMLAAYHSIYDEVHLDWRLQETDEKDLPKEFSAPADHPIMQSPEQSL